MHESTLVIIKPDAVAMGIKVANNIANRYRKVGLRIKNCRKITISPEQAEALYAEHIGKSFWPELRAFTVSGPSVILQISGVNAIQKVRELNGATNPTKAAAGTIRKDYGSGNGGPTNAVHGSDSPESAEREIHLIFG